MAATCQLIGWKAPLSAAVLKKLYSSHAAYVAKVDADAASLVRRKMLLPEDADALKAEARSAAIP